MTSAGMPKLYSWLYRIAHNECLNHLRRMKRGLFVSDDAVIGTTHHHPWTAPSTSMGIPSNGNCKRPSCSLPDKQRAVFTHALLR